MNIKTVLKSSVAAAALIAVAAPSANAGAINNGNKNSMTISGNVARTMYHVDDGTHSQTFLTDGTTSRSRIRWVAKGTLNENVTAGATIEMDVPLADGAAGSSSLTDNGEVVADTAWAIRHQYVWVAHKKLGTIKLGHTDSGGNGSAEKRFAKTSPIDNTSLQQFAGSTTFVDTTGGTPSRSTVAVGVALTNFDGQSRDSVIRYDTPSFAGFGLAGSFSNTGTTEFALKYSGKFSSVSVSAAIAQSQTSANSTSVDGDTFGSIGLLHDSGFNVAAGYAERNFNSTVSSDRSDPNFMFFQVGYNAKIFGVGGTAFAITYQNNDDVVAENDDATAIGVTAVQYFDAIGANVGVAYRNYDLDRTGKNYDSIDVFGLQAVVNF
ncbi:MAG: hypothetical protein HQ512_06845 [Rhodospirillales bacterium]|nr:hypothetical protein [Rhodospirillales bacterium]